MKKYVCLHGHFYQPPRENPWIETIELQDSAYPFHDWNERIAAECYEPNAHARILNPNHKIENIINNYQYMSFNFGPTLISWIKNQDKKLLDKLIEADIDSQKLFNSHGAAIAQAYNHIILPLASSKDKYTQILWGINDFKLIFSRDPEGFWLPETAVDLESLSILADFGIKFVILSPKQAHKIRKLNDHDWQDVTHGKVDTTRPYLQNLANGKTIVIFFYNGEIAHEIAFGNLLSHGENFVTEIMSKFNDDNKEPQLVNIAVDGETYGHHHRYGEMALAYVINAINNREDTEIILYADFIDKFPPQYEVDIFENSSWSCSHGIERWKNNCGCNSGLNPEWHQNWRAPLRHSLDFLRDTLNSEYEQEVSLLVKDPWQTRNDYINVINNRDLDSVKLFESRNSKFTFSASDRIKLLKWMELQRHLMLMYTSCGWFFDEVSGIETTQVIQYAARAIQLANELLNKDYESQFLELLAKVPSNLSQYGDAKQVYEFNVKPAIVDANKIVAHYAISSLFESYDDQASVFCYQVDRISQESNESGKSKVALGCVNLQSKITFEEYQLEYGAISFGDQNLNCSVSRKKLQKDEFNQLITNVNNNFNSGNLLDIVKQFSSEISERNYSLKDLFCDKQRKIVYEILDDVISESTSVLEQFADNHTSIINYLTSINIPIPKSLLKLFDFITNQQLKNLLHDKSLDFEKINNQFDFMKKSNINLNKEEFSFLFEKKLESYVQNFIEKSNDLEQLKIIRDMTYFIITNQIDINLWRTQNIIFDFHKSIIKKPASESEWHQYFYQICENINLELN